MRCNFRRQGGRFWTIDLVVANIGLGFDFAQEIPAPWEELLAAEKGTPEYALSGVVEPVWYLTGSDYGLHDEQYTFRNVSEAAQDGVVISSEPLTRDSSDWTSVPFQHVVFFRRTPKGCDVTVEKLEF